MGSNSDLSHCRKIEEALRQFEIQPVLRIASAHKVPEKVLDIIREYEKEKTVFITVAGRSNALSGFVDANTTCPVIASPPYSDKFCGADLFSSLRMPTGVSPVVVLEPDQAALAAVKILATADENLRKKIKGYQDDIKHKLNLQDKELRDHG
jgi:5-(carboxyamino)imidazole ribonucleotide mutase